jgi:hypothetical protein
MGKASNKSATCKRVYQCWYENPYEAVGEYMWSYRWLKVIDEEVLASR